jgi:hypothetical protein
MTATFLGVRHHSPACARVVREAIRDLRPAHVLVEGPADMNDRMGEVLLDHRLPIAVFTSYRDRERHHASWSPLCAHSPEWVALVEGRAVGAEVRFVDLPAWHPALARRANRYSDADLRHARAVRRLCSRLGVDNVDALWDHLFEVDAGDRPAAELAAYFDLVRGDAAAAPEDAEREAYMASWVVAALADAGPRPVVVVTGGFHRPALVDLVAAAAGPTGWPAVPAFPADAVGGSHLVPFSFRRLDAFAGYESGMPSPRYYQRLWEAGPRAAGEEIVTAVVNRLRERREPVSTADLVAARALAVGLARLRGHAVPSRTDVLDGLAGALVTDALDRPLPWTGRGRLPAGTEPVVVEMVAALTGDDVGRLHPDTPHPPLVEQVRAELERWRIPERGTVQLDLTTDDDRARSRLLHRLRVLGVPDCTRRTGPAPAGPAVLHELWELHRSDRWLPALVEAGSYGATPDTAAAAALADRSDEAGTGPRALAAVLFDAVLCGLDELSVQVLDRCAAAVGTVVDLAGAGRLLATALGLWRHDGLLGARSAPALAAVVDAATTRVLWLVEGVRGARQPADGGRLAAVVAVRDAVLHAAPVLRVGPAAVAAAFERATAVDRPPDLRGAAIGMAWVLAEAGVATPARTDPTAAVRATALPAVVGDFLAGLFAVAREQVLAGGGPLDALDDLLERMSATEFLVALPSLRLAFSWFPPRERAAVAQRALARRGARGSARSLLRLPADPVHLARADAVEARVDEVLAREALLSRG